MNLNCRIFYHSRFLSILHVCQSSMLFWHVVHKPLGMNKPAVTIVLYPTPCYFLECSDDCLRLQRAILSLGMELTSLILYYKICLTASGEVLVLQLDYQPSLLPGVALLVGRESLSCSQCIHKGSSRHWTKTRLHGMSLRVRPHLPAAAQMRAINGCTRLPEISDVTVNLAWPLAARMGGV